MRDHGEQGQKQLSSLPVIAGWIFASEVSFKGQMNQKFDISCFSSILVKCV